MNNEATRDPALAALRATDVSAVITAPQPSLVERAMYLTQAGPDGQFGTSDDILFGAGHESAGVPAPALSWFLAEGATGPYFDEFILIANPGASAADVEARYLLVDGTVLTKAYTVPPASRFNIWVNEETFPGLGKALTEEALSATLTSTNGVPIIVERSMWWPRPAATWMEAHNTPGATAAGTWWALAEGEAGGPAAVETYILIANTSPFAGKAIVTLVLEGGGLLLAHVDLPANSRTNVPIDESRFPGVTGRRFGVLIQSGAHSTLRSPRIRISPRSWSSAPCTQTLTACTGPQAPTPWPHDSRRDMTATGRSEPSQVRWVVFGSRQY